MRATVFVGTSLDGFIARANGGLDFLPENPEPHGFEELLASVDALVMGRKTYEPLLSFGGEWFYGETPVVVLSTRPMAPPPSGWLVEQMSGTPSAVVARLESRRMRHIYVDGGETIQRPRSAVGTFASRSISSRRQRGSCARISEGRIRTRRIGRSRLC